MSERLNFSFSFSILYPDLGRRKIAAAAAAAAAAS
jgi:hypothetical protein